MKKQYDEFVVDAAADLEAPMVEIAHDSELDAAFQEGLAKAKKDAGPQAIQAFGGFDVQSTFCEAWPQVRKAIKVALGGNFYAGAVLYALDKVVIPRVCPTK